MKYRLVLFQSTPHTPAAPPPKHKQRVKFVGQLLIYTLDPNAFCARFRTGHACMYVCIFVNRALGPKRVDLAPPPAMRGPLSSSADVYFLLLLFFVFHFLGWAGNSSVLFWNQWNRLAGPSPTKLKLCQGREVPIQTCVIGPIYVRSRQSAFISLQVAVLVSMPVSALISSRDTERVCVPLQHAKGQGLVPSEPRRCGAACDSACRRGEEGRREERVCR